MSRNNATRKLTQVARLELYAMMALSRLEVSYCMNAVLIPEDCKAYRVYQLDRDTLWEVQMQISGFSWRSGLPELSALDCR